MINIILILLASAEGFILSLSFPNIEMGIIPFIGLLPSLFIIKYTRTYKGIFFLGWLVGIVFLFFSFDWIIETIDLLSGSAIPQWLIYPIFILVCIIFSLKFALIHLLMKVVVKNFEEFPLVISFPVILSGVEFIIPSYIPFFLGNLLYKDIYAMQIIDITGMSGLTFIMGLSNALIFTIVSYFLPKFTRSRMKKIFPYISVSVSIIILLSVHLYGYLRIENIEKLSDEKPQIKIGLIQPNTPLSIEEYKSEEIFLYEDSYKNRIRYYREKCLSQTKDLLEQEYDLQLVIWPESSLPNFIYRSPRNAYEIEYKEKIRNLAYDNNIFIYINNLEIESTEKDTNQENLESMDNRGYNLYNNSILISPDGSIIDDYRKIYLLPFIEYSPINDILFKSLIPNLDEIILRTRINNIEAGEKINIMNIGKWRYAPQLDFESTLPDFTGLFTALYPDFIINTSNDRWLKSTKAVEQLLILTQPRSIENRMYIVRSSNSGISTVYSATGQHINLTTKNGREISHTSYLKDNYMHTTIRPLNIETIYKKYGNVFGRATLIMTIIISITSIILGIIASIKRRR